uniref:Uncharacterized protein n=1 Tax=Anolis carolinensis TaxID=28377 RepID=A0A803TC55_ANOCA
MPGEATETVPATELELPQPHAETESRSHKKEAVSCDPQLLLKQLTLLVMLTRAVGTCHPVISEHLYLSHLVYILPLL